MPTQEIYNIIYTCMGLAGLGICSYIAYEANKLRKELNKTNELLPHFTIEIRNIEKLLDIGLEKIDSHTKPPEEEILNS